MIYKPLILRKVNNSTGIKAIELSLAIMTEVGPGAFHTDEFNRDVNELLDQGQFIFLEYLIPNSSRIQHIYFPQGTSFEFHNRYK